MHVKHTLYYHSQHALFRYLIPTFKWVTGQKLPVRTYQQLHIEHPNIAKKHAQDHRFVYISDRPCAEPFYADHNALFQSLFKSPAKRLILVKLLGFLPGIKALFSALYSLCFTPNSIGYRLFYWLIKRYHQSTQCQLTFSIFLKGLAIVYLLTFLALFFQAEPLLGPLGLSPISSQLPALNGASIGSQFFATPSLFWFFSPETALKPLILIGLSAAFLLFLGLFSWLSLITCWLCFLSIVSVGDLFFQLPSDHLLLELSVIAMLMLPFSLSPFAAYPKRPSTWLIWTFRLVLVKALILLSWQAPFASFIDPSTYHQFLNSVPVPSQFAWHLSHLPALVLGLIVFTLKWVPSIAALCCLGPRSLRQKTGPVLVIYFLILLLLGHPFTQVLLWLCCSLFLFQDAFFQARLSAFWAPFFDHQLRHLSRPYRFGVRLLAIALFLLHSLSFFPHTPLLPAIQEHPSRHAFRLAQPLLAPTNASRQILALEGRHPDNPWKAYTFKRLPGDPLQAPKWLTPILPRLDHTLIYYSGQLLSDQTLLTRLGQSIHAQKVNALFERAPFTTQAPTELRFKLYRYQFSPLNVHIQTQQYWSRRVQDEAVLDLATLSTP